MNHFTPSAARAREFRAAMDGMLWSGVRDLLGQGEGGQKDPSAPALAGPTDMLDYAAYFDLAMTPPNLVEVPVEAKAGAAARLRRRQPDPPGRTEASAPRITNYSSPHYTPAELDRMQRWWDIEPANRMALTGIDQERFESAAGAVGVAMEHLSSCAPELHEEIGTIIRDIVLSKSDETRLAEYGAASSLALWGAFTINAESQRHWAQMFRQIVHESAHNLLFAISREGPQVDDEPGERIWSPVRPDPRPIDGIFHAAFVSAREAYAFDRLLCHHEETGCLTAGDAQVAEELFRPSVFAFWDCAEILRSRARLTGLGDAVLGDCEAFMKASFAVEAA